MAFLLVAFLMAELGLLVFAPLGRLDGLLVALVLAPPLTLVEAVAGKGSDNFFVPFAAFVLLRGLLGMGWLELACAVAISALVVPGAFLFLYSRGHSEAATLPELRALRNYI